MSADPLAKLLALPAPFLYPVPLEVSEWEGKPIDAAVFQYINGLDTPWLDPILVLLSANMTWAVVGGIYVLWSLITRRWPHLRAVMVLGLAIILADMLSYRVLKPAFARPRPCYAIEDVQLVGTKCGGEYGLPSNHAANALAVTAASFFLFGRRAGAVALVLSILVGFSRIKMGVHYPGDVLLGFVVGGVIGTLISHPLRRWVGISSS